ncbi:MAG: hypothetical protein BWX80_02321 [Candidatus Hydrogenedentes bacterium ADurb.Bin101]|nr:MAG: hypothetical protein BWX80_02321 [Candidatus Hydrogenedentes bacterium ADurb.Bin101]
MTCRIYILLQGLPIGAVVAVAQKLQSSPFPVAPCFRGRRQGGAGAVIPSLLDMVGSQGDLRIIERPGGFSAYFLRFETGGFLHFIGPFRNTLLLFGEGARRIGVVALSGHLHIGKPGNTQQGRHRRQADCKTPFIPGNEEAQLFRETVLIGFHESAGEKP